MSRIGRMPISVPAVVDVKIEADNLVTVFVGLAVLQGDPNDPLGAIVDELVVFDITFIQQDLSDGSLLNNMVVGVTEGFKKNLEVNGVGYRVAKEGKKLVMNLGFSHQVIMEEIEGISGRWAGSHGAQRPPD